MTTTHTILEESTDRRRVSRPKPYAYVDADVHPVLGRSQIVGYLSEQMREHFLRFGHRGTKGSDLYPKIRHGGRRLDARPDGGAAGSSLDLMREQLLDKYGIQHGVLLPLQGQPFALGRQDLSIALCRAVNEGLRDHWLDAESRLLGSICVPFESPHEAAKEILHWAKDKRFVQVMLPTVGTAAFGDSRYWPMYAAAADAGLPLAVHLGGTQHYKGSGPPSFYIESHNDKAAETASLVISLVCQGVFTQFPTLKFVLTEGGLAWAPSLMWAMDSAWTKLREEVPYLKVAPSELFQRHFWFTTQPIEEPDRPEYLAQTIEMGGMAENVVFASDYPHWDFDSPARALRHLPRELREKIHYSNGLRLYGLR